MGKEINPQKAFHRLFGGSEEKVNEKERLMQRSIMDFVSEQRQHLERVAGQEDRRKMDEYFVSIREIEYRLNQFSTHPQLPDGTTAPSAKPENITEHIRLMYDLMVLAFQTDSTRIANFMLANEGSNRTFPMIEVKEGHHDLFAHNEAGQSRHDCQN